MLNRYRYPTGNSCLNFPPGSFSIYPVGFKKLIKARNIVRPCAKGATQAFTRRQSRRDWLNLDGNTLAIWESRFTFQFNGVSANDAR